jgi:iron only hydrogenase large subunit-like protein
MASLLKTRLAEQWSLTPNQIYHVSVGPCYDKKLEASRPELSADGVRDTDSVVTTGELEMLWKEQGMKFPEDFGVADIDDGWYRPLSMPLSSSGGTLPSLLLLCLKYLFGTPAGPADLLTALNSGTRDFGNGVVLASSPGKNADVRDWTVTVAGEEKLRFGQSFGFRNIQNTLRRLPAPADAASGAGSGKPSVAVVRKPRAGKARSDQPYHFVEVMACPSGCLNGGGQLRPDASPENPSAAATPGWLDGVRDRYEEEMRRGVDWEFDGEGEWYGLMGGRGSESAKAAMRTVFRGLVKEEGENAGLSVKW